MLSLNIQLFASKKGVGSTKNGRDSESNVLELRNLMDNMLLQGQSYIVKEELKFYLVIM